MSAEGAAADVYKLKTIKFFGREVPIVMQNDNGPCPLLAISNILLLRNQIQLPLGAPDVSQDRLISAVAGYLLDCNSEERLQKAEASAEYRANLHRNIADTIATLPKLCTGVDVNVKFHDFRGFEFTDEVAVFDLLDMSLVHGWLVDPQDQNAAPMLGDKTYNEVVERLVTIMGSETPKHLLAAVTPLRRNTGSLSSAHRASSRTSSQPPTPHSEPALSSRPLAPKQPEAPASSSSPAPEQPSMQSATADLDGEEAAMLQEALSLSLRDAAPGASAAHAYAHLDDARQHAAGSSTAIPLPSAHAAPHHQPPADMLGSTASAQHAESSGQQTPEATSPEVAAVVHELVDKAIMAILEKGKVPMEFWQGEQGGSYSPLDSRQEATAEAEAAQDSMAVSRQMQHDSRGMAGPHAGTSSIFYPAGASASAALPHTPSSSTTPLLPPAPHSISPRPTDPHTPQPSLMQQSEARARELAEAEVISSFLDSSSSQLTAHGLVSLQQGLRPRQLAVFFRNNHFNVLFCHERQLYLLITDQGYLWEQDVVWERLCAVNGDTDFVREDFTSFAERSTMAQAHDAALLAQEAFSSVLPPSQGTGQHADSDYALALQLQEEEVQRRKQLQQQQQQQQQQEQSRAASSRGQQRASTDKDLQKASPRESRQSRDSATPRGRHSRQSARASAGSGKEKGSGCKMM